MSATSAASTFLPTREQIRRACEEIQNNWSEREREKRRVGATAYAKAIKHWTAPLYSATELAAQFRRQALD